MNRFILAILVLGSVGNFAQAQTPVPPTSPASGLPVGPYQPARVVPAQPFPVAPAPAVPVTPPSVPVVPTAPTVPVSTPAPTDAVVVPPPASAPIAVVAPAVPDLQCANRDDKSSICVNDRVIYDDNGDALDNKVGFIKAIYSDLTGVVAFDDGVTYTVDLQYVAREVSCIYGFCSGDAVLDGDHFKGRITDAFENGVAEVSYPNGEVWYLEVNELTSYQDDPIPPVYTWPAPRPYPDVRVYGCVFPHPPVVYVYEWPHNYRHYPTSFGDRSLRGVCPLPPARFGYHPYQPYPFDHYNTSWGARQGVRSPDGNRHVSFPGYGRPPVSPVYNSPVYSGGNRGNTGGGVNPRPVYNSPVYHGGNSNNNNGGGRPNIPPSNNGGGVRSGGNPPSNNNGGGTPRPVYGSPVFHGGGSNTPPPSRSSNPAPSRPSSPPPSRPSGGGNSGGGVRSGGGGAGGGGHPSTGGGGGARPAGGGRRPEA